MLCAFGMLVQCWGILQTEMPSRFSTPKVIAIVGGFTKLHYFFIDIHTKKDSDDTILDLEATTTESSYLVVELDKASNEKICKEFTSGCNQFHAIPNQSYFLHCKYIDNLPCIWLYNHVLRSHRKRPKEL